MDKYIKQEAAIAIIEEKQKELCPVGRYGRSYVYGSDREKYDAWDEIIDALENIPAADVVPVTRCKDCEHAYINSFAVSSGEALCTLSGKPMHCEISSLTLRRRLGGRTTILLLRGRSLM